MEESEQLETQLTVAQEKVTAFKAMRAKIRKSVTEFEKQLTQLIKENLKNEEIQDGLFTGREADYLSVINKKKLESVLKKDENHWVKKLQKLQDQINPHDE